MDYHRVHTYDAKGRPELTTQTLRDGSYTALQAYDNWGRLITQTFQRRDDAAKIFSSRYNRYGYLSRVERGSLALWEATELDAAGRITGATLGNGLQQKRIFSPYTGRLENADIECRSFGRVN